MKADIITMRINPDLKRQAEALCNDMGFTLSTAYNAAQSHSQNTQSAIVPDSLRSILF